jgi:hypothetical protein
MALILAALYFGLVGLLLVDSSRELAEARRFRARILALTLAENGAELAARNIIFPLPFKEPPFENEDGIASGMVSKQLPSSPNNKKPFRAPFDITAEGQVKGLVKTKSTVTMRGGVIHNHEMEILCQAVPAQHAIEIDYTKHSQ